MKETGHSHAIFPSEEDIAKALPKSDHIKESALIRILKPLLNKVTEEDLKIYSYASGTKQKVQFTQYPVVDSGIRQIFDVTGIFRNISQLNAVCHMVGYLILQYLFITRKGIKLSSFTSKFLERESLRNFRMQLSHVQTDVKESFDMYTKGIITKEDFDRDMNDFISGFSTDGQKKVAARFIDDLIESGEQERSRVRVGMQKSRMYEAKYSGLKEVGSKN